MSNVIARDECPHCGEEPDDMGFQHLFNCPGKLTVSAGQGTVERTYVAVDALLSDQAIAAASAPWLMADDAVRDAMLRAVEAVKA